MYVFCDGVVGLFYKNGVGFWWCEIENVDVDFFLHGYIFI